MSTKMFLCEFQRESSNRLISDHIGAEWEINEGKIFKNYKLEKMNQHSDHGSKKNKMTRDTG